MLFGLIIRINANSPLLVWVGLEINLLAFIPVILESKSIVSSSNIIKYFLIQTITSLLILFFIVPFSNKYESHYLSLIFLIALFVKIGLPPYHFWLPRVMQSMSWVNCLVLSTLQKVAPLLLIRTSSVFSKSIFGLVSLRILVSSLGGLAQTNLRPLIAYSSIHHIIWCYLALLIKPSIFYFYISAYFLACIVIFLTLHIRRIWSLSQLRVVKAIYIGPVFVRLISLAGLPPILGFFPKMLIILNLTNFRIMLILILLVGATLNLVFYFNFILSILFLKVYTYDSGFNYQVVGPITLFLIVSPYFLIPLLT